MCVCVCVLVIEVSLVSLKPFSFLSIYSLVVLQFLTCCWVYVPCLPDPSWEAAPLGQWRAGSQGTGAECFCQLADQLRDKDSSLSVLTLVSSQDILVLLTSMTLGSVPIFIAILLIYVHVAPFHYRYVWSFHSFICGDHIKHYCLFSALLVTHSKT